MSFCAPPPSSHCPPRLKASFSTGSSAADVSGNNRQLLASSGTIAVSDTEFHNERQCYFCVGSCGACGFSAVTFSKTQWTMKEELETVTYTVQLSSNPGNDVFLAIADNVDVAVTPNAYTFTTGNWNSPVTFSVTANSLELVELSPELVSITHSFTGALTLDATVYALVWNKVPPPPLPVPTELKKTGGLLEVMWEPHPPDVSFEVVEYVVERTLADPPKTGAVFFNVTTISANARLRATVTGLVPQTYYFVRIVPKDALGFEMNPGDAFYFRTMASSGPSAPVNMRVLETRAASITIGWDVPLDLGGQVQPPRGPSFHFPFPLSTFIPPTVLKQLRLC